ncbi:MAG: T9SS type A sorting domain-containing protein [Ignavibacteria bacterium]|jgi:hypothetical protein
MVYNLQITNPELRKASTTGGPIGDLTWELPNGYNSAQSDMVTDLKEISTLPKEFVLNQNYPNPFTTIKFDIVKSSSVKLIIYNILGQKVATLVNEFMTPGSYKVDFIAADLSSGVYFYSLETSDIKLYKKMMLLK